MEKSYHQSFEGVYNGLKRDGNKYSPGYKGLQSSVQRGHKQGGGADCCTDEMIRPYDIMPRRREEINIYGKLRQKVGN